MRKDEEEGLWGDVEVDSGVSTSRASSFCMWKVST